MNYDLAKLNHNLTLEHEVLSKGMFTIDIKDEIVCDVFIRNTRLECKKHLKNFCENKGIDFSVIETLSSIIWMNMSPLHEHPLDIFLYYFGKYNLYLNLK